MRLLPVVARELKVAARRPGTYRSRTAAACLSILIAALLFVGFAAQQLSGQGRMLLSAMASVAFAYCVLAGMGTTADCVSSEKREGTLGLLFLTDLRGVDVVLGKLVSCSLNALYGLLAFVPVMALALLLGGVTGMEVMRMSLLCVNTLFCSLATGVLASTLSRNDRRAMFATGALLFLWLGLPYLMAVGFALWQTVRGLPSSLPWPLAELERASPLYAFQNVRISAISRLMRHEFYSSILTTHILSWGLLVIAASILPRACRERPPGQWRARLRRWQNRWSYGSISARQAVRAARLDRNAFYWLASRERPKGYYAWGLVLGFAAIWGLIGWKWHGFVFDWDVSFWALFLLLALFKVWITSEVCSRLAEDRAGGAFELLLASPLQSQDMARGVELALWRQFGGPLLVTAALSFLLLLSALQGAHYDVTAGELKWLFCCIFLGFLSDIFAIKWTGIWQGTTQSRLNGAFTLTYLQVLFFPTVVFLLIYVALAFLWHVFGVAGRHELAWGTIALLWLTVSLAADLFYGLINRWRVLHRFREIASHRFIAPEAKPAWGTVVLRAAGGMIARQRRPLSRTRIPTFLWKRRLGWSIAALCLLGLLSSVCWRVLRAREVRHELAVIRAHGEPASLVELQRWLPEVSPTENAGPLLQRAGAALSLTRNAAEPIKLPAVFTALDLRTMDWIGPGGVPTSEINDAVSNLLARNRAALSDLHAAAQLPQCRYPTDWRQAASYQTPYVQLGKLRPAAAVLQLEAWLRLARGEREACLQSLWALLGLARAMAQEPYPMAQDQRSLALSAALGVLERLLAERPLAPSELESLQLALLQAANATSGHLWQTLVTERCLQIDALRNVSDSSRLPPGVLGWQEWAFLVLSHLARVSGYADGLLLDYVGAMRPWLDDLQAALATRQPVSLLLNNPARDPQPTGRQEGIRAYFRYLARQHDELTMRLRVAAAALAIERHRAAHHDQLPATLQELEPGLQAFIPLDPFGHGPLTYLRRETGYVLYSFGLDQQDNHGIEASKSRKKAAAEIYDLSFQVQR